MLIAQEKAMRVVLSLFDDALDGGRSRVLSLNRPGPDGALVLITPPSRKHYLQSAPPAKRRPVLPEYAAVNPFTIGSGERAQRGHLVDANYSKYAEGCNHQSFSVLARLPLSCWFHRNTVKVQISIPQQ
jgi:hypothetical protein